MPIIVPYKTEAEWLEMRKSCITSTEISALFGESPYQTEFELWHRKKDGTAIHMEDNDRLKWGRRLEAPIAAGLAEDNDWKVSPLKVFMIHSKCKGMGSSFDYDVYTKDGRKGILEIKTVDFAEYKKKWITEDDDIEAPTHIELQLQHQLEVADAEFGIIAALVSGNKPVVIKRERDHDIGKMMVAKVKEFWQSIEHNIEPVPDYTRDAEIIRKLYSDASGNDIDLTGSNRFAELVAEYPILQGKETEAKKAKDAAKAEMIMMMKNAPVAKCGNVYVSAKIVNRGAYSVEAMQYRDFRVKTVKGK